MLDVCLDWLCVLLWKFCIKCGVSYSWACSEVEYFLGEVNHCVAHVAGHNIPTCPIFQDKWNLIEDRQKIQNACPWTSEKSLTIHRINNCYHVAWQASLRRHLLNRQVWNNGEFHPLIGHRLVFLDLELVSIASSLAQIAAWIPVSLKEVNRETVADLLCGTLV